ncbi:hypothetical protein BC826DRAFT_998943 [Russula brevipes]|nr:hypothetical protein BC826DRAFT_998943 [Russula brevipes]
MCVLPVYPFFPNFKVSCKRSLEECLLLCVVQVNILIHVTILVRSNVDDRSDVLPACEAGASRLRIFCGLSSMWCVTRPRRRNSDGCMREVAGYIASVSGFGIPIPSKTMLRARASLKDPSSARMLSPRSSPVATSPSRSARPGASDGTRA